MTAPRSEVAGRGPGVIRYFARAYPVRTGLMALLFLLAAAAEGMGILTLLPVLEWAASSTDRTIPGPGGSIVTALEGFGLTASLATLLGLLVGFFVLKGLAAVVAHGQAAVVVARVAMELRLELLRALLRAEWRHVTAHPTGHLAQAIGGEAHRTSSAYLAFVRITSRLLLAAMYALIVVAISWRTALLAVLTGVGVLLVLRGLVREAGAAGRDQMLLMRSLIARLTDTLPGLKPIKAMAREDYVLPLLESEAKDFRRAQQRAGMARALIQSMQEPLIVAVLALGLWGVLMLTELPFAEVLVLAALFYRLTTSITYVQDGLATVAEGEASFVALRRQIDEAAGAAEPRGGRVPAPDLDRCIALEGVCFAYDGTPVLRAVSLEIQAGEMVALTGPSGAGKTTLCDHLTGLLRPAAGRVLVDGVDLADVDPAEWRGRLGYVPQEPLLFDDSIKRNVTLGVESISDEAVALALRRAGATEFVSAKETGVEQRVGERGHRLSGGQRQRIALARALVGSPRLLILDEPTASLDAAAEAGIRDALEALKGEITIVAISHRPAMVEIADRVLHLRGGEVSE